MSKVSVVIPTYNVARWLPEFLTSLDGQTGGLSGYELIFVDDGSTDDSAAVIDAWIATSDATAQVVRKSNGGLSSARNAGLAVAAGEWVTFWDPDDKLAVPYCTEIREFVESPEAARVDLIVGRLVKFAETTGRRSKHPLDHRFARGDRVIDLEDEPTGFHLAANSAFYRVDRLREHGLRFDERVVPTFEDGHLTGRYLARVRRPQIAVRSRARYLYRRRADQSSLVQAGWQKDVKYLAQPRHGWLDLLRDTKNQRGAVPEWAQYMVLYELVWYYRSELMIPSRTAWVTAELSAAFHEILDEVLALVDAESIERFGRCPAGDEPDLIAALLIGAKGVARPTRAVCDRPDEARRVARLRYFCGGGPVAEQLRVHGRGVTPAYAKTRRIEFIGRTMAAERILWVAAGDEVSLSVDGVDVPLRPTGVDNGQSTTARPAARQRSTSSSGAAPRSSPTAARGLTVRGRELKHLAREVKRRWPKGRAKAQRRLGDAWTRGVAAAPPMRTSFRDAWLLMDEVAAAGGEAEELYRFLRERRPEVNAWFVLARDSTDWARLAREGFRLIEHGQRRHRMALLNAAQVISATAQESAVDIIEHDRFGPRRWRWTFLPRHVVDADLAHWLNPKPIDLILTGTAPEHAAIVGGLSRYRYGSFDVALTGRPGQDTLLRLARSAPATEAATVLFVPSVPPAAGTVPRSFVDERAAAAWYALLSADRLHKAAAAAGLRLAVLLNDTETAEFTVPEQVTVHRPGGALRQLVAGCAVFVTDYSSLVHDAAFLDRVVVHCRFDAGTPLPGVPQRPAAPPVIYGPVCGDPDTALDALVAVLEAGRESTAAGPTGPTPVFPYRDGNNCVRAHARIRALGEAAAREQMYVDPGR